jgi:formylglycine-generating enzyme required for sulfatase activity
MSTPAAYPLESFLQILVDRGIVVDTRARIRLQALVAELGKGFSLPASELGAYIAPVLARSAEEQELILQLWQEYIGSHTTSSSIPDASATEKNYKKTHLKILVYAFAGLVFLSVLLLSYVYLLPLKLPDFEVKGYSNYAYPTPGDSVSFRAHIKGPHRGQRMAWQVDSLPFGGNDSVIAFAFDTAGNHSVHFSLTRSHLWRSVTADTVLEFPIRCKGEPHYAWDYDLPREPGSATMQMGLRNYGDSIPGVTFEWDLGDSTHATGSTVTHTYDTSGTFAISVKITNPLYPDCPQYQYNSYVVGGDTVPQKASFPRWGEVEDERYYAREVVWPWVLWVTVGLIGLVVLLYEWLRRRAARRKVSLQALFQADNGGPYRIPWPEVDGLIRWDETLDRVAALMAGRSRSERLRIDLHATVRATLSAGGLPTLRYAGHSRPTAWLVLLDEEGLQTHERRLLSWLVARLKGESVVLDLFHYRGQPDRVWSPDTQAVLPLSALQTRFPDHRLVILSRGQGLLHPLRAELHPRLRMQLNAWAYRTLLTPEHPAHWGGRERAVAEDFGICPVDAKAMRDYLLLPELPDVGRYLHWRRHLMQLLGAPDSAPQWLQRPAQLADLRDAAGGGFVGDWAVALHSYPELVYELSLRIGAALKPADDRSLRWQEIWQLLRLPFMREERLIRPLRKAAAEDRSAPVLLSARQATAAALESALATLAARGQRGMAYTKSLRELTLQRFALAPHSKAEQASAHALIAAGLASTSTPELQQLRPEKGPRRWRLSLWITQVLIFMGTLVGLVLYALPSTSSYDSFSETITDRLGLTEVRVHAFASETRALIRRLGVQYAHAEAAYQVDDLVGARDTLNDALDSYTVFLNAAEVDSFSAALELAPSKALLFNALGLCQYYLGNYDFARSSMDIVTHIDTTFYRSEMVGLPNLSSLLNRRILRPGRVLNAAGTGINGARLVLRPYDGSIGRDTLFSDADGNFTLVISERPANDALDSLIVELPGYQTWRQTVSPTGKLEVRLQAIACPQQLDVDIQLAAGTNTAPKGAQITGPGLTKGVRNKAKGSFVMRLCGYQRGDRVRLYYKADGYVMHDTTLQLGTRTPVLPLWKEAPLNVLELRVKGLGDVNVPAYDVRIGGYAERVQNNALGTRKTIQWTPSELAARGKSQTVTVEALGYKPFTLRLTLPAKRDLVLQPIAVSNANAGTDWTIQVRSEYRQVPVPAFEVLIDGKSVAKGENGKARIPASLLPNKAGFSLLLVAQGFADYNPYIQDYRTAEFTMSLRQELVQLLGDVVPVEGGPFWLGSGTSAPDDKESLARRVEVKQFYLSKYEVTQAQWYAVMGAAPSYHKGCEDCPVESVSLSDCQRFLQQLNALCGTNFRLPTETEWEYAARGGRQSKGLPYPGSQAIDEVAWYQANSKGSTQPVGRKPANELGLFDLAGNVSEWCQDAYGSASANPVLGQFKGPGNARVIRGGSWDSNALQCTAIWRGSADPGARERTLGLRLARD